MIKKIEKYSADWCSPCKILGETLKPILEAHPEIEFIEYNAEKDEEAFEKASIKNIPQLFFYDEDDTLVHRITGARSEKQISDIISWHNKVKTTYSPYNHEYYDKTLNLERDETENQ